jgi:HPt (histidine-containing phosphotransfer) domain-containing protein
VDEAELIDWDVFCRARSELGAGFARILSYFQEDGEKAVGRIEEAMHRRDAAGMVLPAHTMKSEARQFGADPLGELAEEIEFAARRFVEMRMAPDELVPHVARLRPLYVQTMALLEAEANPLCKRTRAAS